MENENFVSIEINGVLDLHHFNPRDLAELIPDYISLCLEKGIDRVRIIHGKGSGALRDRVHSILRKLPRVVSYEIAPENAGGWGATLVLLS
ncbi:MAG: Smr/MutS family protein [Proteobacteria bacterium]|nr:Smr/MutS family protein [Pseudomonadota bacterium]